MTDGAFVTHGRTRVLRAVFTAVLVLSALADARAADAPDRMQEPASLARAYLRAVYARNFSEAYRYVSSEDQRAKNLNQYLRQRDPFKGFALDVAKLLASMIEVEVTAARAAAPRMLLTARYKAPDPEKISALVRGWNAYQLNSLSPAERRQVIDAINKKKRDQSLSMISGEEKLTLVKEGEEWRIFLDWARGVTVGFHAVMPEADGPAPLDVSLSRQQAILQPGEVFEISVKIRNPNQKPIVVSIGHLIQPQDLADHLQIVQCGFLLPVRVQPGAEQEYSGTYLLRGSLPEGIHQLNLDYDFRILREP
jgi:hypothetical protein